jgi:hypothetical protein
MKLMLFLMAAVCISATPFTIMVNHLNLKCEWERYALDFIE